ncbi:uncharacterized protein LOC104907879 isoform X2 [Beta vulgaris subsp. vulgaris]|uniref:uncharacterized protein LOC104907879 isoform X2 n=1 Tax=Beta vulgaris subsp. vulgaris TaxID=3555 RepID=UPI0025491F44|nr:uncharacterized protein LOC104907879 isoform X2 [Beta vulgaris subsp. vulgaris]
MFYSLILYSSYCMKVKYGGDRREWVCEECDSSKEIFSSKPASSKQSGVRGTQFIRKPPKKSKVQYLTPEEARSLESGAMRKTSSSPSKSNYGHGASTSKKANTVFQKEHGWGDSPVVKYSAKDVQTSNTMMRKETDGPARKHRGENPTAKQLTFGKLPKPGVISGGHARQLCTVPPTAKRMPRKNVIKDDVNSGNTSLIVQSLPTVSSGLDVSVVAEPKNIVFKATESPRDTTVFDRYLPNPPANPTWKGTFKIITESLSSSFLYEIQAHPSCKLRRRVYELSRQLPMTLVFEMLPRQKFWLDFFEDDVPGELDIGLYFFPSRTFDLEGGSALPSKSTCGHEQSYYSILEYVDGHDLVMRSRCIDEVELFVFSSKHLQEKSRFMNQKHFLWGVFCPSDANRVAPKEIMLVQNSEVRDINEEHEAEDMDVDMLGGHEVGTVDVVVPKPLYESCGNQKEGELEIKASSENAAGAALEFSLIKVKKEQTDAIEETSLPYTISSCVEDELEFEKELQKSFDRFAAIMQVHEVGCSKTDVKEEVDDV